MATGEQSASRKACGNVNIEDAEGNMSVLVDVEYVPTDMENQLPVSATVENGFNFSANDVGETVRMTHLKTSFQSAVIKVQGL